jgi:hypothetical protein
MSLGAAQRREILALVGREHRGVLEDLDALLDGFSRACRDREEHARFRYQTAPPRATARAAQRIARAAQELQAALDAAPEMLRQRLMVRARALGPEGVFDGELLCMASAARDLAANARATKAAPGPKGDPFRKALDLAVGSVLARHGLSVTAYDSGLFARVLTIVEAAATGRKLPTDPRPRLRPVARKLRARG